MTEPSQSPSIQIPIKIFVYGTLKPSEENYDRYCRDRVVQVEAAMILGRLFDLPFGYPALCLEPDKLEQDEPEQDNSAQDQSKVCGFVLTFAEAKSLAELDELEDYDPNRPLVENEYIRVAVEAFSLEPQTLGQSLGQVWVYQMQPELIEKFGGVWLPQGIWSSQGK